MPAIADDLAIEIEHDRHDCCCQHVVEHLDAAPGPGRERYAVARDKFYSCPHRDLTPLEIYLDHLRQEAQS